MTIKELREKRNKLIADARAILDAADKEKRAMTAEEQKQFDALMTESDTIKADIERREKIEAEEKALGQSLGRRTEPNQPGQTAAADQRPAVDQREFQRVLGLVAERRMTPDEAATLLAGGSGAQADRRSAREYNAAFRGYLRSGFSGLGPDEYRALQADSDVSGGGLVAPQQFLARLIRFVNDQVFVRRLGTVVPVTSAESLGVPSLDTDPADADWTSELATGNEDSSMAFGKRELHPRPLAKRIKVSNKLLRLAALDPEGIVNERLAYKFAISQEKAFMTGTGANQPLGLFTASAQGISTARDVNTGNSTTAIVANNLIECKHKLKVNYWPRAQWIFHRDAVKTIRQLKDSNGQYLWVPGGFGQGLNQGNLDQLLGLPMNMSEYAPNTFTSGKYVGIVGDYSLYWIADFIQFVVQRLVELYAEANQVGFIGRGELDGMPVLEEAFIRVTLA